MEIVLSLTEAEICKSVMTEQSSTLSVFNEYFNRKKTKG